MPLKEPEPDFLLTRPEEIRSAIFELTHQDCTTLVRDAADRETAILVLGIDKQTDHFFWRPRDFAGSDFAGNDSRGLRVGTVLQFHGNGYGGVQIHFRVPRPELVRFDDGSAAFVSPLPERVSRIQRRKLFRASIIGTAVRCAGQWRPDPKSKPILFSIRDISVEGIGMRVERLAAELPPPGAIMEDVYLDFGDFGNITTDLQIRTVIPLSGQPIPEAGGTPAAEGDAKPSAAPATASAQTTASTAAAKTAATAPATAKTTATATAAPAKTATAAPPPASTPAKPMPAASSPPAAATPPARASLLGGDPLTHIGAEFSALNGRQEAWLQQVVWRLEKARTAG